MCSVPEVAAADRAGGEHEQDQPANIAPMATQWRRASGSPTTVAASRAVTTSEAAMPTWAT